MILQDTFAGMVMSGFEPDWLLRLDVPQFDSLAESWQRVQAGNRLGDLSVMRVAQHAEGKDYRNFTRDLKRDAKIPRPQRDAAALDESMARNRKG